MSWGRNSPLAARKIANPPASTRLPAPASSSRVPSPTMAARNPPPWSGSARVPGSFPRMRSPGSHRPVRAAHKGTSRAGAALVGNRSCRQSGHKPSEQGGDDERAERPPRPPLALVWGDGDSDGTGAGGPVARVGALVAGQGANRAEQGVSDAAEQRRQ